MATNSKGIYYNTSADAPITEEARALAMANSVPVGPNYIINGAFDIWQRGTSLAHSGGGVGADMWRQYTDSGSGTQTRDTSNYPAEFPAQSYRFTATANSTNWSLFQLLETANCVSLASKVVTFSIYLVASSARTFRLTFGTNVNTDAAWTNGSWVTTSTQDVNATTSWQRFTFTVTVPSTAKTIQFGVSSNGANMASGSWVNVAGIQLEEGTVATPFRRNANSIQAEFASCQRYYQRIDSSAQANRFLGSVAYYQGTLAVALVPLITQMRTRPSVSISAANTFQLLTAQANLTPSAVSVNANDTSPTMIAFDITSSTITTTAAASFRANNTTNTVIQASSEL